jgi:threonine dehydrogenase-like Zn-dependent dehydrogenase
MEASGSTIDSVLQATKIQLDKTHALRECMGSVRRGGTISLSGVYGGMADPMPMPAPMARPMKLRRDVTPPRGTGWKPRMRVMTCPLETADVPSGEYRLSVIRLSVDI